MVMDIQVEEIVCKICGKNEHSKLSRLCVRCGHPLDSSSSSSSSSSAAATPTTTTTTTTFSLSTSSLHLLSSQSINDFDSLPLAGRGVVV
jgi:ribosomal protein L37E